MMAVTLRLQAASEAAATNILAAGLPDMAPRESMVIEFFEPGFPEAWAVVKVTRGSANLWHAFPLYRDGGVGDDKRRAHQGVQARLSFAHETRYAAGVVVRRSARMIRGA